ITNCKGGARELFGGRLPAFETAEELQRLVARYLKDPSARERTVRTLRKEVLAKHTYRHRAATVKAALSAFAEQRLRIGIKMGIRRESEQEQWGDYHFAHALRRALERKGCHARVDILPEWDAGYTAGDDVALVLRGRSAFKPRPGIINIMWLLSHPDE